MTALEKLLDIIAKWDGFGQGLFLIFIAILLVAGVVNIFKLLVVLFRGWPSREENEEVNNFTLKSDSAFSKKAR